MTLLEQIKKDQITARKAKNGLAGTLLTTLIGEAEMIGKNAGRAVTDDEVKAVIKKFVKGMDETLGFLGDSNAEATATVNAEKAILKPYLPEQMSEKELADAIELIIDDVGLNLGKVMGALKAKYLGKYDGTLASNIAKAIIK